MVLLSQNPPRALKSLVRFRALLTSGNSGDHVESRMPDQHTVERTFDPLTLSNLRSLVGDRALGARALSM